MKRHLLLMLLFMVSLATMAQGFGVAQNMMSGGNNKKASWGRDTTDTHLDEVPIGVSQWTIDERLGHVIPAENIDTLVHMFQWYNETSGYNGEFNILGNLGSPRLSRIYMHRDAENPWQFLQPFDFSLGGLRDFRFSNTLSPMTNLAYHKVGNTQNGQERLHAYFASNINKYAGIGFRADYLYGRGYYNSQANSQFLGNVFGYYLGDRYNMHAYVNFNHFKMAENGGIEDDAYIRNPQSFPRRYSSKDIPTLLTETWNRNKNQDALLTHRVNLGFEREIELPDSARPKMPSNIELLSQLSDSIQQLIKGDTLRTKLAIDSLQKKWTSEQIIPKEFVPVTSIIHTVRVNNLSHTYYSYNTPANYYTNHYYGALNSVKDRTKGLSVRNTVGVALREGFNKWAQMGIALFANHQLTTITVPDTLATGDASRSRYTENEISVGGEINRTEGRFIHYNVSGEVIIAGDNVGDFDVDGEVSLDVKLGRRDTLQVELHAQVNREDPNIYFQHYHSQFCWWDYELDKEYHSRFEGKLSLPRIGTHLHIGIENVKNYVHYAIQNTYIGTSGTTLPADYSHSVTVRQTSRNIQVFHASLRQNLAFGPWHWDNDITYQTSSNQTALPLPKLTLYSNMYMQFKIAKVLRVQVGGDVRYFTKYYAPDYSPAVQQFAVQDNSSSMVKVGNYPIVNAYVNLHIKHCRLYVAMNHINAGTGRMFWAPHYPMDPRTFHFGLSWNFFN